MSLLREVSGRRETLETPLSQRSTDERSGRHKMAKRTEGTDIEAFLKTFERQIHSNEIQSNE